MLKDHPIKLLHITTVPGTLNFFRGQVGYMKTKGFEVHALSSPGEGLEQFGEREHIAVCSVEMPRRITPLKDLVALLSLWKRIRQIRPHIVHAHTPKGGLLGMVAATLTQTPVRIYHIHGLPMVTATGSKRTLLRWTEKISCRLANQVLCVSHSVREVAIAEGLCPAAKVKTLLNGSVNGVDAQARFNPDRVGHLARLQTRAQHGMPAEGLVIGFVGRLVRDKGLVELSQAWQTLRREYPGLHLMVVGPFEPRDPVPADVKEALVSDPRVHLLGNDPNTPPLYSAMDIVILPTYREGFPNVPMEAAAMGLPVVATDTPGCVEAVLHGMTGQLVPARDSGALAQAIKTYVDDPELRRRHGAAGRQRMLRDFHPEDIWEAVHQEYRRLLRERGVSAPEPAVSEVSSSFGGVR